MKLILLALCAVAAVYGEIDSCPNWHDWRDWTSDCVWGSIVDVRAKAMEACDIEADLSQLPGPPAEMPTLPAEACGYCSSKLRCRKRSPTGNCFPVELETQTCTDSGTGVCTLDKVEFKNIGCNYGIAYQYIKQCMSKEGLPDWKRRGYESMMKVAPELHCVEDEASGKCKCCCHPYVYENGACVEKPEPECNAWTPWTPDYSSCLWMPFDSMKDTVKTHCGIDDTHEQEATGQQRLQAFVDNLPQGFKDLQQCGFCSFKLKCRKRALAEGESLKTTECFPFQMQKQACGESDCTGCGSICTVPQIAGSCNFMDKLRQMVEPYLKRKMSSVNHNLKRSLMDLIGNMPHAKCTPSGDQCKCCCHPYEPSADGQSCVLKDICKGHEEHGININWNVGDEDAA